MKACDVPGDHFSMLAEPNGIVLVEKLKELLGEKYDEDSLGVSFFVLFLNVRVRGGAVEQRSRSKPGGGRRRG